MRRLCFILLLISFETSGQLSPEEIRTIDSLKQVINKASHDSVVVNALKAWDEIIYLSDVKMDFELNVKIKALCEKKIKQSLPDKELRFFLTAKAFALNNCGLIYSGEGNSKKAIQHFTAALDLYKKLDLAEQIVNVINNLGYLFIEQGEYARSEEYILQALKLAEKLSFRKGMLAALGNYATIHQMKGNYAKSIECYMRSLKLSEQAKDKINIGICLLNIGLIYKEQGNYARARDYYYRVIKLTKETKDKGCLAAALTNLGVAYMCSGDSALEKNNNAYFLLMCNKALPYYRQSLRMHTELNEQRGVSIVLSNIGSIHKRLENYDSAMTYFMRSLAIDELANAKSELSKTLINIGNVHLLQKNYKLAIAYVEKGLNLAITGQFANEISYGAKLLHTCYKKTGQFKLALQNHELYVTTRDSISSDANTKEVIRQEYKYQYEKRAVRDSIKRLEEQKIKDLQFEEQKALAQTRAAELENKRILKYTLFGGLILLSLFAVFIYSRFHKTKQQKKIIEEKEKETNFQKEIIEAKQKEIIDSINYARRIQIALLPQEKYIMRKLSKMKKQ